MPDMTSTSLAAGVVLRTCKIIKNGLCVFRQKSYYKVRIYTDKNW